MILPNRHNYQSNWLTLKDSNNALVLSPARVYSAKIGRFLQKDMLFQMTLLGQQGSYWNSIFRGRMRSIFGVDNYGLYRAFSGNPYVLSDPKGTDNHNFNISLTLKIFVNDDLPKEERKKINKSIETAKDFWKQYGVTLKFLEMSRATERVRPIDSSDFTMEEMRDFMNTMDKIYQTINLYCNENYVAVVWQKSVRGNRGGRTTIPDDDSINAPFIVMKGFIDYYDLAHEIGHILGLEHPHELKIDTIENITRKYGEDDPRVVYSSKPDSLGRVYYVTDKDHALSIMSYADFSNYSPQPLTTSEIAMIQNQLEQNTYNFIEKNKKENIK